MSPPLLPTPHPAATRKSRKALTAKQWAAPDIEQSLELARGELPREYESADEVRGASRDMLLPTPTAVDMGREKTPDEWDGWTQEMRDRHGNGNGHGNSLEIEAQRLLPTPTKAMADGGNACRGGDRSDEPLLKGICEFGPYQAAIDRWTIVLGRPAPPPTEPGKDGRQRLSAAFVEWMMSFPEGWVTDPALAVSRTHQLKLLGNAVVPSQCILALQILLERMHEDL